MAQFPLQLNQTGVFTLDAANNDIIYIEIKQQGNQYAQIEHINYGYIELGADQRTDFGVGLFEIIANEIINPGYPYGAGGIPDATINLIYCDSVSGVGGRFIDFNRPLIIPAGQPALLLLSSPVENPAAGSPLGAMGAYLTVIGSYQSDKNLAALSLR